MPMKLFRHAEAIPVAENKVNRKTTDELWEVSEVMEGINHTMRILNTLFSHGRIDYGDYCDLHDALCAIGGKKEKRQ